MQVQHHVNKWPLCKDVAIDGSRIGCTVDYAHTYDFMDAYQRAPHEQFLNMGDDRDLARFVASYGPLYFVNKDGSPAYLPRTSAPEPVTSTTCYWTFQRWLKSLLQLIDALRKGREGRETLLKFVEADIALDRDKTNRQYRMRAPASMVLVHLKLAKSSHVPHRLQDWLREGDDALIREAAARIIEASICVEARLLIAVTRRKAEVTARFRIRNLAEALQWMCWQDEFHNRPLVFCAECPKLFRPLSAHPRKFCSYACGHRVAARKWRKQDLVRKKVLRAKRLRNGEVTR